MNEISSTLTLWADRKELEVQLVSSESEETTFSSSSNTQFGESDSTIFYINGFVNLNESLSIESSLSYKSEEGTQTDNIHLSEEEEEEEEEEGLIIFANALGIKLNPSFGILLDLNVFSSSSTELLSATDTEEDEFSFYLGTNIEIYGFYIDPQISITDSDDSFYDMNEAFGLALRLL